MSDTSPALAAVLLAVVAVAAVPTAGSVAADPDAEVVARYPSDGEMVEEPIVSPSDVTSVEAPENSGRAYSIEMTLTTEAAAAFSDALVEAGFTDEGVSSCPPAEGRNDEGYCLVTVVNGEAVNALGVAPAFADAVESGEFEDDARFQIRVTNESDAERVARAFGADVEPENSTTTGDETTTDDASTQTTTEPASGDSANGTAPGFGVLAAVVAVAGGASVVARRD